MKAKDVSAEKQMKTIIAANEIINRFTNHDPFYIARQLGIRVIFTALTDNVKAFITRDAYGATIFITKFADSLSRKILCAHELGHFVNGDVEYAPAFFDIDIDPEKEYLANVFMSIIFPQAEIKLNANPNTDITEINQYFERLIRYNHDTKSSDGELKILNDSSTIFDTVY